MGIPSLCHNAITGRTAERKWHKISEKECLVVLPLTYGPFHEVSCCPHNVAQRSGHAIDEPLAGPIEIGSVV